MMRAHGLEDTRSHSKRRIHDNQVGRISICSIPTTYNVTMEAVTLLIVNELQS